MVRYFTLLAVILCAVTAHAANCDYLSIALDEQDTDCQYFDWAYGHVDNSSGGTLLATVVVDVSMSWNFVYIGISFGDDEDSGDGSRDLGVGAFVGANSYADWTLILSRESWDQTSGAYVTLGSPCAPGFKSVRPEWDECE